MNYTICTCFYYIIHILIFYIGIIVISKYVWEEMLTFAVYTLMQLKWFLKSSK